MPSILKRKFKMAKMNTIISSVDFPMIVAKTDSTKTIRVRKYKDKATNATVLCNYTVSPCSPVTGGSLIPEGNKVMTLSSAEIDKLESLGICPSCGCELKAHKALASKMTNNDFHCIICGEELHCSEEADDAVAPVVQETQDAPAEELPVTAEEGFNPENAQVEPNEQTPEDVAEKADSYQDKVNQQYDQASENAEKTLTENEATASDETQDSVNEQIQNDVENEAPETAEEVRVDMLSKCESNLKGKTMEIVSSMKDTYHYLMISRKPVATIHKSRAIPAVKAMFDDKETLLKTLTAATEESGFTKEVISNFGIVPVVLKVTANDCIKKAVAEAEEEMTKEFEEKKAQMEEDNDQCLGMAAVAVNRNLIQSSTNVLADDLIAKFEGLGIEDARQIVESSFAEVGEQYLRSIIVQAKEYAKESSETRNVLARTMLTSSFQKRELGHKVVPNKVEASKIEDTSFNVDSFRANLSKLI